MIRYRPAEPHDMVFVRTTWSTSYKSAHAAGMIASERWTEIMHGEIADICARPYVKTIVAYENATDFLYGFICARVHTPEPPVVFYIYVKGAYRAKFLHDAWHSNGLGRGLFEAIGVDPTEHFLYACKTPMVNDLSDAGKIPRAKFVPATARYRDYSFETLNRRQGSQ